MHEDAIGAAVDVHDGQAARDRVLACVVELFGNPIAGWRDGQHHRGIGDAALVDHLEPAAVGVGDRHIAVRRLGCRGEQDDLVLRHDGVRRDAETRQGPGQQHGGHRGNDDG